MSSRASWLDFGVLRQGLSLGWEYGLRSLEGFGMVADVIERTVYDPASLERTPNGFAFTLLNPPLRMGAFGLIQVLWDGVMVPPDRASVQPGPAAEPRLFASVDRAHPVTLPVGLRSRIEAQLARPAEAGPHQVRLQLRSVAIPCPIWFEFTDAIQDGNLSRP